MRADQATLLFEFCRPGIKLLCCLSFRGLEAHALRVMAFMQVLSRPTGQTHASCLGYYPIFMHCKLIVKLRYVQAPWQACKNSRHVILQRGENWHGTTAALGSYVFAVNLALSILLSFGFGVGGSFCLSFVGFTTCHSRLHLRRKYGLQSACCLPERIDDCLVHTVSLANAIRRR